MLDGKMLTRKYWRRAFRKKRDAIATRLFDTRLGRDILVSALGPRVKTMTVDCGDHVLSFSPADYIGRKVFRKGHFERDHVDRLLSVLQERGLLRTGVTLLELGGNIGTQTCYFALSKAYDRIITVEPDPRNFRLLSANIADNGFDAMVTAVNCAAGDRGGELDFYLNHKNHGKSSALRQSASDEKISVPVRTVPDILAQAGTDPADIGLIWMDIEGYEPVACRSMIDLMAAKVPLYMEFTPAFYGKEQARIFVAELAGHYSECLAFFEDRRQPMRVIDLPVDGDQFDVLFLP
ncbi:FkbM family methyltransferase [Rhizobium sp. P38BS-XIX]|uniref:FkbM family methyltransferase n=1 Tax=Rhizobium sp. P38BS-XIX TaxID=2726740 RepID=UPI001456D7D0|nr:FkbM family methyltransferase [Rhizobium sp. P38BS-XIX]NLR98307.1 FkbM family methyltransferase [Rhizobium sp. P38BS-XIX]